MILRWHRPATRAIGLGWARLGTNVNGNAESYAGRTAWARSLAAPVRDFLGTETGSASVLLAGAIVALRVGELAVVALL